MQMKIVSFLIPLFITVAAVAQQPVYTVSTKDLRLPAKEASFSVAIMPEKVGTAFRLNVQNPEKKRIEVKISHREIGLVVDTSFTEKQFNCRYNFDQVEDGYYQLTLVHGKERVTRNIEINTVTKRNVVIR
jgi:hypothetical protein